MSAPDDARPAPRSRAVRAVAQAALGLALAGAGTGHLTTLRQEFQAQVPPWLPLDPDLVVLASGVVELALGGALLLTWRQPARAVVGATTAVFFVAVFPGNVSQLVTRTDAFGLDSDTARAVRLAFQPVLVAWALWGTGAWRLWRERVRRRR
ncbi:DoxX family protein [Kineococcus auxinigenes]|uniref:DoxX family protein n=1 Tax=unclassified Kineococcus TaxID=2621656 RepID=UPI003D7E0E44